MIRKKNIFSGAPRKDTESRQTELKRKNNRKRSRKWKAQNCSKAPIDCYCHKKFLNNCEGRIERRLCLEKHVLEAGTEGRKKGRIKSNF